MKKSADIALVGLAVMGENLVLNMESKGYTVVVYNRTLSKVDAFLKSRAKGKNIIGVHSLEELVASLNRPRKIMLMIKAGKAVDSFIEQIINFLEPGDIIVDGGNSHYQDTIRRTEYMESRGLLYIGTGISGGEQGALHGPSIMPGGSQKAWPKLKPILQSIAAKLADGTPCCDWIGSDGAGHFVKMVHNGIEYGDMQLIAETYQLMRNLLGMTADEMHTVFEEWNRGELESYLIEITGHILQFKDEDGLPLVNKILDRAGQKGTGKWTAITALDMGIPLTLIAEAVFARCLSAKKQERVRAAKLLSGPRAPFDGKKSEFIRNLKQALYACKIISYTQGYTLMHAAAAEHNWKLDYGNIALMWRNGCIIRSAFLQKIKDAYAHNPQLNNLLLDPFFKEKVLSGQTAWRRVTSAALNAGIPVPAFASALCYFDGYRSESLPANLIQAQRDYFGAHTYERVDRPEGEFFHTDWTGKGGATAASVYTA
ncbi:MAG: decarboxylating NADP(+)-dependent phosphogluconate dehydrogenase [Spirochaetales bacterium]|nr:decarboxylating NADP(+)-dependent phosphogluconate dehydrogenase [Spirochaetales bacterium]